MNAKRSASLLTLLALVGCASPLPKPPEQITRTLPITTTCVDEIPSRPELCKPVDNTRQEYLRCVLINRSQDDAYIRTLQAVLTACKGEKK